MSQSDSFFNEVSEEVRKDSFRRGLQRYGWIVVLAIVLAVGAAAVFEWQKFSDRRAAENTGDALRAALLEGDPAKRDEALAEVAVNTPSAAAVARLAEAGSQIEAGESAAAAASLATLAEAGDVPEIYRSLAALLRVMLLGDAMDATERGATLETLANPESPFQPLALEQRALLRLSQDDKEGALADLGTILTLPQTPEQVATRARQLILAAGGVVPSGPAVIPAMPGSDG